jgi:hypothetical protein
MQSNDVCDHGGTKGANLIKVESNPTVPTSQWGRQSHGSPDHLVGLEKNARGHRDPKRLGGLEVDDQLECRGLLHRQVRGFRPCKILATSVAAQRDRSSPSRVKEWLSDGRGGLSVAASFPMAVPH